MEIFQRRTNCLMNCLCLVWFLMYMCTMPI
uniref:Uncharacterized protein n=1 Tax=Rhizophora mucronata TaxID=61149 RepID=A0A2P2N3C7_RHIMU